jgi:sortase (surface protein transpeptidase)
VPAHRKPPNKLTPLYTAIVVAVAAFAVVLGFGGSSKKKSPSAQVTPSVSATTSFPAPSASADPTRSPTPTPKPTPKPKPKPTSTGLGTNDATLHGLTQHVQEQPVRIRIPALKVNAPIIPAAVDSAGALTVPANVYQAAWFQAGNAPGQPGTAIVAAHVDFQGVLGLFNGLHTLPKGAAIYVTDASGHVRVFHVTSGTLAPKSDPSTVGSLAAAAARPGQPRLALITCGGDLNVAKHSYYDNFVLLADL